MMKNLLTVCLLISTLCISNAQVMNLENFEDSSGWNFNQSDGVTVALTVEPGISGNAIRFDYDFTKGTGYGGIQKWFPIDLPENYEFTFYLKADSPSNNFEIKFIDSTGNNVWWVNNRNFDFPGEWKKIRIKKRHISFAWGPTNDQEMKRIDRIEFTVASYVGGKGTLWLDNLTFSPLPPDATSYPEPEARVSSSIPGHPAAYLFDGNLKTGWQAAGSQGQKVLIDFKTRREFGGLHLEWLNQHYAETFHVLASMDGTAWDTLYTVPSNRSETSFIMLREAEARYLLIDLEKTHSGKWPGIAEVKFLEVKNSLTTNDFLIYTAQNSPKGNYPRSFLGQATYWTLSGVNNDVKEALISEDGMVEAEKGLFSVEPMLRTGDSLYNWTNASPSQSLNLDNESRELEFTPNVTWTCGSIFFNTAVFSTGSANQLSDLNIQYTFENRADTAADLEFYLLVRPFQVNPYYQWLNLTGGAGRIYSISEKRNGLIDIDGKTIQSFGNYDAFSAVSFDQGNIVDFIRRGSLPAASAVKDASGMASAILRYPIRLDAGQKTSFFIVIPYHFPKLDKLGEMAARNNAERSVEFWQEKTGHIRFNLPPSADRIIQAYRANLAYILINRDNAGIQPGSRSYERSWIRDGALTSSALLKSGIVPEVKEFITWYSAHLYENGKVPCVVDSRGPDPVPENDSHGEFIYLIREYFNFTGDTAFLRSQNEHILKVVDYMASLIAERSTDYYKFGNDSLRAHYGLVPESISHEGYSAKPMHSYWDNFFTVKGLKDAAEIQKILGENENYRRIAALRDTFTVNLYNSIDLAMKYKKIDYIPGCVELGDFDATSTTIALTPCNELNHLPKPQVYNTFDKYYDFFVSRRDGKRDWINYTPYENRLIGSFILLDQPERAHELIRFFLDDQRPEGWHHWAEVVWKDDRYPGFIGDMPHTWCGSDFINSIRSMFVYENEYDHSLVLAAALYQDWIDAPDGMSVENIPTYYGEISYSIKKEKNKYLFSVYGDAEIPSNGIKIRNFNGSKMPSKVKVNGKMTNDFNEKEISVMEFPAKVEIHY